MSTTSAKEIAAVLYSAIKQAKNETEEQNVVKQFIAVLKRTGSVQRGPAVIALVEKLLEQDANILRPIVTSATALTDEQLQSVSKQLQSQYEVSAIHIDQRIDPSVLGGISIQVNDMLYDATLKKKLLTLTNTLKQ